MPEGSNLVTAGVAEGEQPLDDDLTAIAGLSPSNNDIIQRKTGAWTNRTIVQLITDLALIVRTGTGVPSGAPTSHELPLAYDDTAVTGGFYYWNSSAWVKVATIL